MDEVEMDDVSPEEENNIPFHEEYDAQDDDDVMAEEIMREKSPRFSFALANSTTNKEGVVLQYDAFFSNITSFPPTFEGASV